MYSLLIDSANQPLSVALMKEEQVIVSYSSMIKQNHSVQLMPHIQKLLETASITPQDLTDIVVAQGPGSYTGLRIGVTVAKTLAYTLKTHLYGVSSLKALAATITHCENILVPIINARRGYVYAGVYRWNNGILEQIIEDQYILLETLISHIAMYKKVLFIGQDVQHFKETLQEFDVDPVLPRAEVMWQHRGEPQNVHRFVPQYLKLSEAEQNWLKQQN
ncbi:tRNA (adenosine(37)-N6)-threonylcarbamoyltransferase complex dimerization subunit type 1 TsaB [Staphylococcus sp. 17KM0847]|uniref:tRNA (adenosine(37)-N6)-threonylcarbamoyltransferase complex dimerization subunit type 1 TsaB n=1 Tax=Staphylococcus sp. 17KM0847 TaxID=2583989 RepID=UPI0015DBDB69|nr:tRNA (adenosine(37)-N6)-threonylcarbamoyltransferase complex dimerization subunit type 1 TsaB [Staphylococcus sp. 17KM0847]QLK86466.1 tRNA (adenosine(37)-N6)-threonylcarbamoyltransferase complex dimerization subunit type 1 TsaB [Staphylococcus sp. 17KM0847]